MRGKYKKVRFTPVPYPGAFRIMFENAVARAIGYHFVENVSAPGWFVMTPSLSGIVSTSI
jgi:hypothetical protein